MDSFRNQIAKGCNMSSTTIADEKIIGLQIFNEFSWHFSIQYKQQIVLSIFIIFNIFFSVYHTLVISQYLNNKIRKQQDLHQMKTVEQLKSQIYAEVDNSGYLKSVQAQVKAHVLELIDKQSKSNKQKLGFQYQHPLLNKLKNYPLTSLCMDLIQQFLQSFKFKHTLNVFKKEVNRDLMINRQFLTKQFSIDLSGKDQSVLLSIVGQIVNGDVKIIDKPKQENTIKSGPRKNNFINEDLFKENDGKQQRKRNQNFNDSGKRQEERKPPGKEQKHKKYEIPDPKKSQKQQQMRKKIEEQKQKQRQLQLQKQRLKAQQEKRLKEQQQRKQKQQEKQKEKGKGKGKKFKKQQEKAPQGASDLLADVVSKFHLKKDNKKSAQQEFLAKKAFSQQKEPKKIVPEESGSNKIRGVSMGKIFNSSSTTGAANSFMKYTTFNQAAAKNEQVDEEFDESKDSTRKNPLYSSSESGFDKSYGYDQSVDSMAIQDYQYVEKAKKFSKKS